METKRISIAVRPKTNSCYTAKKLITLATVDVPVDINTDSVSKDEWNVLSKNDLDSLITSIRERVNNTVASSTLGYNADKPTEIGFNVAKAYLWYAKKAEEHHSEMDALCSHITTEDTLSMVRKMWDINSHIEIVALMN